MSSKSWFALSLMMLFMLGTVAVNSFGAIDISQTQLNVYNSDNHYGTALRKGTADVEIIELTITSTEVNPVTWQELRLTYTGTRLADVGTYADLHDSGGVLISQRSIGGGVVTFPLSETIPAGGTKTYKVKLDIAAGSGSNKIALGLESAKFSSGVVNNLGFTNPNDITYVDASPPVLDKYPTVIPNKYEGEYNTGTKILKLRFYDEKDPIGANNPRVKDPRVRLVWADGTGVAQSQVDLSKIQLRAPDDDPTTNLSGASLLCPPLSIVNFNAAVAANQPTEGNTFPDGVSAFSSELWIKLTPAQDAYLQNTILADASILTDTGYKVVELYINGALWDAGTALGVATLTPQTAPADGDCKNLIAEKPDARIIIIGDTTKPAFVAAADKPAKFDSLTRTLTLSFTESINAIPRTMVELSKIHILNYRFDELTGDVIVDMKTNLSGASVTEGYGTSVNITLTASQRDVLKGEHPKLYLDANAVKDISGNGNLALVFDEDLGIDESVNVLVTPPFLSGVETLYDGDLPSTVEFDLVFSEEISSVNPTKITITNEKEEGSFSLSTSEFDTIKIDAGSGVARLVNFNISKSHRDMISKWQLNELIELRVILDKGAVVDVYGNANDAMTASKMIGWDQDDVGPIIRNGSTYSHSTRLLRVYFDEQLDLTPEGDETIDDLVNSSLITLSPGGGTATGSVILTNGELVPNQGDDWALDYTLTNANNDTIAGWRLNATEILIGVGADAVRDINGNLAVAASNNIPTANWIADTVKPTFSAAYYSVSLRSLVIRFSESIGSFDLSKIWVHAAGKARVQLTGTPAIYGDVLQVTALLDDAHNAIAAVGNPQVDLDSGAVSDLSGNLISGIPNKSISYDDGGPSLSSTGNTYEHLWVEAPEGTDPHNQGLLTLTFNEIIDVETLNDLGRIMLSAGTTAIPLSGEVIDPKDATMVKIKIVDDDVVGGVAGLQKDYDTLFVEFEAGAVKDLAGNPNLEQSQALNSWIGDTRKPELDYAGSYYIHAENERGVDYARLALKFNELMDTRADYIVFSGIVVADSAGNSVTLTAGELKPGQDALSDEILFNLTDDHRDIIGDWGKDIIYAGGGKSELYIYLSEGAVSDRAGNSIVLKPVAVFAVAKPEDDTIAGDQRTYDPTLTVFSTWEKDLKPAEYVSSTYNGNTKEMTITFAEWMDQAPPDATTLDATKITIKDKNQQNPVVLAATTAPVVTAYVEQAKTKTVKFTLTPEVDALVKALVDPLYLDLAEGAAVDYSGVKSGATTTDKKITYTKDTTKPTLVQIDGFDGVDTSYWHAGNLFESGDITGLLTLVFSEAVDKEYVSIDATKIRLSHTSTSGTGFALTQAEVHTAPGFRVYPLAAKYRYLVQFNLNDAHWNTIAEEKWPAMYVHIAADAFKDTVGNKMAATVMAIHADYYKPDQVAPDVRLPEAPIATAPAGQDLVITAPSITDDSTITEVRLYYQVGGAIRTYALMENTTGSTYVGTIPGTAVTNRGLCYYVWAVDLWGNDNVHNGQGTEPNTGNVKTRKGNLDEWHYTGIPGGFNVLVTGASVELPANNLPVFDAAAVPSTYRMISVPITPSPAVNSTTLFTPFGVAGIDWVAWKFTGGPQYNGYDGGHINPFTFSPSVAAWVGTVNPNKALMVKGNTPQLSNFYHQSDVAGQRYLYEITLHAGWNQIAVPFNFSRNWDKGTIPNWSTDNIADVIYWFSGEKSAYSFASLDSTVPNQDVFATSWTGAGIPDNELVWNGWPGSLDPWGGYWLYSDREGAVLKIDPTVPGKGVLPSTPTAPAVEMPYNWSVKVMPEAGGVFGTAKFAGIVSDASNGIDNYDVMDLPALPGQIARLAFTIEDGDYLQDMKAPADEMFWYFNSSAAVNTPVTLRFDASAVPSEYRTVLLIDTVTETATDLRKASSYAYKSAEEIRNFKLIISKAHIETYMVPKHSVLLQNYPNPFNPETWVPYRLSTAGDVNINIYNVTGQLVRTLALGHREAGSYTVKERSAYWDGRNATGERVASGVYFYNIQSGSFHATKRMVIVK